MKLTRIVLPLVLLGCGLVFASRRALGQEAAKSGESKATGMAMGSDATKASGKLTKMEDHKKICMVTNKAFEKDQIPIEVEGRTYYGCCEMCKTALSSDPEKRTAVDPISNKKVDKSSAVIGVDPKGRVLYFENDKTFAAYNAKIDH
jgi:YHS domain-containing protein